MRRVLIVGCGDIGSRIIPLLRGRYRVYALVRTEQRAAELRVQGVIPIIGDLDRPDTLRGLAGIAQDLLHFAPPPNAGRTDPRTAHLIRALAGRRSLPQRVVYLSTSGVYGDRRGAVVRETDRLMPSADRAHRRVDAERRLRRWGRRSKVRVSVLRVPGIYALDRLPVERLKAGTPSIHSNGDSYTNHVHADDLARLVLYALNRGRRGRVYHACDSKWIKAGDYFDLVADSLNLARPKRISMAEAEQIIPANAMSFLRESRRLSNDRLLRELKVTLRYPSVEVALANIRPPH